MSHTTSRRPQRRILEATLAASLLGASPSLLAGLSKDGVSETWRDALRATRATRAIATIAPPGRPDLVTGAALHFAISAACGQVLGRLLPRRHSAWWGAAGGGAIGVLGAGLIGRRFPAIRALPFGRQLSDNVAFGIVFALVADRAAPPRADRGAGPAGRRPSASRAADVVLGPAADA